MAGRARDVVSILWFRIKVFGLLSLCSFKQLKLKSNRTISSLYVAVTHHDNYYYCNMGRYMEIDFNVESSTICASLLVVSQSMFSVSGFPPIVT
jgi:hypothetical protein